MTPKEKAEELLLKFSQAPIEGSLMWYVAYELSKQFSLIAVDEILNDDMYDMSEDLFEKRILYWENVKQEIEKL